MKLTFLGGADEVGASSTLIEISGHRILIDCGIRMTAPDKDALPALAHIEGVEAMVLTHAHLDHVGAMPVVYPACAGVPIYMTPATLQLSTIMLGDAIKVMDIVQQESGVAPLYTAEAVQMVIQAARCVPFGHTVSLFEGEVRLQFLPAGHILGAASVIIEGQDGTIFMTGDISVTDQLTIPGMMVPGRLRPDIVVVESTYGGRAHADRQAEELRIVAQVGEVIERGGSVLFPAFAVGRAQEVILILSRAVESGALPADVPIYVDGLVRQICKVFSTQSSILTPWLRERVEHFGNPFFTESGPVKPVWNPKDRAEIAKVRPSIFVASSGMLTGGPSQLYARALASDPKSHIAITGYQDEESPGRRIQNLAREGGGTLQLGDGVVELKCTVGTYGLSAHADTAQIVEVLSELKPRKVALVHGDHHARRALEEAIEEARAGAVYRPRAGDTLELRGRPGRSLAPRPAHTENTAPPTSSDLPALAQRLILRDGANQEYTPQDLLWSWGAIEAGLDTGSLEALQALLDHKGSPFKRDKKRPFIYRVRVGKGAAGPQKSIRRAAKRIEEAELGKILERVTEVFPASTGLYKRKVRRGSKTIVLSFPFPRIAAPLHTEQIAALAEETGWAFEVRETPHHDALVEAALQALPDGLDVKGRPALHLDKDEIVVKIARASLSPSALTEAQARFLSETGYKLGVEVSKGPPLAPQPGTTSQGPSEARMEINKAFETIRGSFHSAPHQPLKLSLKGDHIELAFISPEIGARHRAHLDTLQGATGWTLLVKPHPDQHRIKALARALVPTGWAATKEPGLREADHTVTLKLDRALPRDELKHMQLDFLEACGYQLVIKP